MCRPVSLENVSTWIVEHPKTVGFGVAVIFAAGALLGYYLGHTSMWVPIGIGAAGLVVSLVTTAILYSKSKNKKESPPPEVQGQSQGRGVEIQNEVAEKCSSLIDAIIRFQAARALRFLQANTVLAKDESGNTVLHLAIKNYPIHNYALNKKAQFQVLIKEILRLAPQLKDVPNAKGKKPIELATNCSEEIQALLR